MNEITKCYKCGCTDKKLIHHHKSYEPEEIVMVCWSCHQKLHKILRKSGVCTTSPQKLRDKSNASKNRLNLILEYQKTDIGKKSHNKATRKYHKVHNRQFFNFTETMSPNVRLTEDIIIYDQGRLVNVCSRFYADNNHKLYYINIK